MKINKIIIIILIVAMLSINATSIFAEESVEYKINTMDTTEQNAIGDDVSNNSIGDIDPSEIMAQSKPSSNLYNDSGVIHQTDKFASYYFSNLEENFGNNTIGSCGYVATAMLLSYYDTYLNDDIIDDSYDVTAILSNFDLSISHSSPGIRRENDSLLGGSSEYDTMISDLNTAGYWNLVLNNYSDHFHLNLIKIAEDRFHRYYEEFTALEENGVIDETGYPCVSTLEQQAELIDYYLSQINGIKDNYDLEYAYINQRSFAINKIKDGQPVILLLGSTSGFHFVVAYDLDDKGTEDISDDDIYAHYGWGEVRISDYDYKYFTHINIDTDEFPWIVSALAINFDIEHSCSNNYVYSGVGHCFCEFACHDEHVHQYELVEGNEDMYHVFTCGCQFINGDPIEHSFVYTKTDSNVHEKVCSECGYSASEEHNLNCNDLDSDVNHYERCTLCDYTGVGTHTYECAGVENSIHKEICSGCGWEHEGLTNGIFVSINSNNHSAVCETCGYAVSTTSHNWVYSSINAQYHEGHCADCGAIKSMRESHSWTLSNDPKYVKCAFCGHLKLRTGGDIIPIAPTKKDDIEEEIG